MLAWLKEQKARHQSLSGASQFESEQSWHNGFAAAFQAMIDEFGLEPPPSRQGCIDATTQFLRDLYNTNTTTEQLMEGLENVAGSFPEGD